MGHFARLQLVGRITYYVGWIALVLVRISTFQHCEDATFESRPVATESVRTQCGVFLNLRGLGTACWK
jgi:hypothetical protein